MGRCLYRAGFVMVGDAYGGEMIVVLMIRRCPQWGRAHCAHEGRCPHWGHAQGACNREVLVMLMMGRYPWWEMSLVPTIENAHNGGTSCGEMLVVGQFLMMPLPVLFVPVVES